MKNTNTTVSTTEVTGTQAAESNQEIMDVASEQVEVVASGLVVVETPKKPFYKKWWVWVTLQ